MILIFKTSVKDLKDIEVLKSELNKVPTMVRWNFDLEDIDNVLRVESTQDVSTELVHVLNDKGFECEDLDDSVMLNMTCTED
ncbi:MAG: hypothetical protein AAF600_01230 [Bacteroidota bacterium]